MLFQLTLNRLTILFATSFPARRRKTNKPTIPHVFCPVQAYPKAAFVVQYFHSTISGNAFNEILRSMFVIIFIDRYKVTTPHNERSKFNFQRSDQIALSLSVQFATLLMQNPSIILRPVDLFPLVLR